MDTTGQSQPMPPRTPTSDFAGLSIGEGGQEGHAMPPVTRSETARRRSQLQAQFIVSPQERTVQGDIKSSIKYTDENLNDVSREAATAAFKNPNGLAMLVCGESATDHSYYFDMYERVRLNINDITNKNDQAIPYCTCGQKPESGPCKHAWWVIDRLISTPTQTRNNIEHVKVDEKRQDVSLTLSDRRKLTKAWHELADDRFEDLCQAYNWPMWTERDAVQQKRRTLDVLSSFEPHGLLPHEIEHVDSRTMLDRGQDLDRRQSASYKQFLDDLQNKATEEPTFYGTMLRASTPELYLQTTLQKLQTRVTRTFDVLDLKCFWATVTSQDVFHCARDLQSIAETVTQCFEYKSEDQGHPAALRTGLAGVLLSIVEGVAKRKGDLSLRLATPFQPSHVDDPGQRNLLLATVGDFDWAERRAFVLMELVDFREELKEHFPDRVERIARDLANGDAPERYIRLLRSLIS